ncbi:MAG TPA: molybdopterin cofactor-binding domain-containing protein [Bryobacteraceae bacterium]|nr:molybdopterin cofactor-binding domain-containing protein [Bryobacteraceae bacterium]
MAKLKRRQFLKYSAGAVGTAGALVVGWSILPPRQRLIPGIPLPVSPGEVALNGWVKVSPDNTVTVIMSQAEMGQGTHTGVAMLLADEMDAAWEQVRLAQSTLDPIYNNQAVIAGGMPFQPEDHGAMKRLTEWMARKVIREVPGGIGTGGSSSLNDQWLPMRQAGASARAALIAAAADLWKVPASECRTESGRVLHSSGKSAAFGELASRAAQLPVPKNAPLKDPASFKLIGKPVRRLDAAAKMNGTATYAIDVLAPGMVYASITMCPTVGGKVKRLDASAAQQLPGVRKVFIVDAYDGGLGSYGAGTGGVAAIADTPFHAMRALQKIDVEWDHGAAANLSSGEVMDAMAHALDTQPGKAHYQKGDVEAALKSAAKTISAEYRVPYLAHATMEPMSCTVHFKDGAAQVWVGTQFPAFARNAAAKVLGIKSDKVAIHVTTMGGGFGRRAMLDFVSQAAAIAREAEGAPVQTLWPREQDMTHDYYRPAFVSRHQAGFDAQGKLIAWKATSAGSSMGAPSFMDGAALGAFDAGYEFPNARVAHQSSESPVPVGIWRSVGHSYNAFFAESFIDESAAAAGADAVAFRAALLTNRPRMLRVLHRAAELSGWGKPCAPAADGAKTARGIALHRCFGSVIANVAEVSLDAKKIRVHRVTSVVDCGFPVNPSLIRQQIEGGIVFGLSAALRGEITLEKGQVQQTNFDRYAPLRIHECPILETDIVASTEHPEGIGETGVPSIAPAVANAVFALTGQRLRSLPLKLV